MSDYLISYAQNREDVILNGLLKNARKGFYVDVGANHPVHDSVTKLFYDKGWSGINVEPAHDLHSVLELSRPRDINVKCGISDKTGELIFREYMLGDGLSTFSHEQQDIYKKDEHYSYFAKEYTDHKVPVTTLANLLKDHARDKQIDFMKIDVEGYEHEAVAGNDWKLYRPIILCIEANHIVKDWHPILEKANYSLVFWDGLNEYFVANEHAALTKDFSYADSVFLSEPFITWSEYKIRRDLERDKAVLSLKLHRKESEVHRLQNVLNEASLHGASHIAKRKLHSIDHKITARLSPSRPIGIARGAEVLPKTLAELSTLLRHQLVESTPTRKASKRLAGRVYAGGKNIARHAVRRGKV